jgi:hypothetical protein
VWVSALVVVVGAVTVLPAPPALAAAVCTGTWAAVATPNPDREVDNGLASLAVVAPDDVWAVGAGGVYGGARATLTIHWDGSAWTAVPSPVGANEVNWLTGVAAVASGDVWAVGYSATNPPNQSLSRTLIEHWDGSGWSVVASPDPTPPLSGGPYSNELYGVAAVATDDVWAVGRTHDYGAGRPLIVHWDGTAWTAVRAPRTGQFGILRSVTAVATDDVWAAGTQYVNGNQRTLVVHWDGATWSVVPSANDGPYVQELFRIRAVAPDDIWAVGYHNAVFGVRQRFQTSIFHWDGSSWSVVPSPDVNQNNNYLFSVDGTSADDAWAVGFYDNDQFQLRTMVQHWDGTSWTMVPSPNESDVIDELVDVVAVSPDETWAVGQTAGPFDLDTLALRRTASCPALHVAAVVARSVPSRDAVKVAVTVVDGDGLAVAGATVSVLVELPNGQHETLTGATAGTGRASFTLTAAVPGTYTFTVTDVAKEGAVYDPTADVETSDSVVVT